MRAKIGKYASENGNSKAIKHLMTSKSIYDYLSWSPCMPPGLWAFTTTWLAVRESATLQKDGRKQELLE